MTERLHFHFIYVFIFGGASLSCCLQAFSRGSEWGHSIVLGHGFSSRQLLLLWPMALRHVDPGVVAHGLSCPTACGIFLDQESNPCPLN